ncbi:hypothetical protein KNT96_gp04 [Gordonia phage KimmyK]|uniref:Uncharacterized protein n=1 Tax=Gordonia phage KimmyK TaxID=2250394 RepID=A0A345KSE1_9CAUD|nr:hypothetical protein KNT96_gp04 [Gordonia phage KimmyK]AXH45943.1 hypothetical protein SEA_KIMMYK_4 [Gordonia phage KimmyK]
MSTADLWWWDVLGALALSVPLYWASSRAGHRWAQWRDLIRQERAIDRREQNRDLEEIMQAWDAARPVARAKPIPHPNITPPTGGSGQAAASMVPLIIHPDYMGDLEDLIQAQGFRPDEYTEVRDGAGRLVRLDTSPDFDDWGSSDTVLG